MKLLNLIWFSTHARTHGNKNNQKTLTEKQKLPENGYRMNGKKKKLTHLPISHKKWCMKQENKKNLQTILAIHVICIFFLFNQKQRNKHQSDIFNWWTTTESVNKIKESRRRQTKKNFHPHSFIINLIYTKLNKTQVNTLYKTRTQVDMCLCLSLSMCDVCAIIIFIDSHSKNNHYYYYNNFQCGKKSVITIIFIIHTHTHTLHFLSIRFVWIFYPSIHPSIHCKWKKWKNTFIIDNNHHNHHHHNYWPSFVIWIQ